MHAKLIWKLTFETGSMSEHVTTVPQSIQHIFRFLNLFNALLSDGKYMQILDSKASQRSCLIQ